MLDKFNKFPAVYPITDESIAGVSHLEQFIELANAGASIVQLRAKDANSEAIYRAAVDVMAEARRRGVSVIINDRVDVAIAVGADGVHLGQHDLPPVKARQLLGKNAIVGFSTHDLDQLRSAVLQPIDYVAIGPVFETSTKSDTDPVVGLDMIRLAREIVGHMPLVAIGGITSENAAAAIGAGADCVAVISEILAHGEISARFSALNDIAENARSRIHANTVDTR